MCFVLDSKEKENQWRFDKINAASKLVNPAELETKVSR